MVFRIYDGRACSVELCFVHLFLFDAPHRQRFVYTRVYFARTSYAFFKMLLLAAQTYPSLEPKIGAFIKGRAGERNPDGTIEQTRSDQVHA